MLSYPAPPQPAPSQKSPLGCTLIGGVLVAIVCFMAFVIFLTMPFLRLLTAPLMAFYDEGRCTITGSQVEIGGAVSAEYLPQIAFMVRTNDGRSYQATGYDWVQFGVPDQGRAQAMANKFVVGKTYLCWYNPLYPSWTVLTRDIDWSTILSSSDFWMSGIISIPVLCACFFAMMRTLLSLFRRRRKYTFSIGDPRV